MSDFLPATETNGSAPDDIPAGHAETSGPLAGVKVLEIAGIGPGPHACMLMADLGADVIRIERGRPNPLGGGPLDFLTRGRPSVALDLKRPEAVGAVLTLVEKADVLVEGMRPGRMERLGLGPDRCLERNPGLIYGRMTGWGQDGPLAQRAGHDLTYLATSGALHGLGQDSDRPHFPSNLLGDFGGGSTYLVIGILAALHERVRSGLGQVVDAAIVDGVAHLNAMAYGLLAQGDLVEQRSSNLLDGGSPAYSIYEAADQRFVAVGALEPEFYQEFIRLLGIANQVPDRMDPGAASELRGLIACAVKARPAAEWEEIFAGSDACVATVLSMTEAADHPHAVSRGTFIHRTGHPEPAPAPRFSRTPGVLGALPSASSGWDTANALLGWGLDDMASLRTIGVGFPSRAEPREESSTWARSLARAARATNIGADN